MIPLLLAVSTSALDDKARAAGFRAAGNVIVKAFDQPSLMQAATDIIHFGFIEAAVDVLDVKHKGTLAQGTTSH